MSYAEKTQEERDAYAKRWDKRIKRREIVIDTIIPYIILASLIGVTLWITI
jgi:hypothetical protein